MSRHLPDPLHPGILHLHVRVEPLRHGVGDQRLSLLLEEFDEAVLFLDKGVDSGGLAVEEGDDGVLFGEGGE